MVTAGVPQPLLSITDVSKAFPGVKALDRVSLEVVGGVVHGIVGENGAGKSTLMKILSGVYEKDSGEIVFEGQSIDKITPVESMRMGLAIIYQELNLVNTMTVGENVFLGRFSESGGRTGVHAKARALLDSIGCKVNTHRQVSELASRTSRWSRSPRRCPSTPSSSSWTSRAAASPPRRWTSSSRSSTT